MVVIKSYLLFKEGKILGEVYRDFKEDYQNNISDEPISEKSVLRLEIGNVSIDLILGYKDRFKSEVGNISFSGEMEEAINIIINQIKQKGYGLDEFVRK